MSSQHGEGHVSAKDRLARMKSLEEILNTAMAFEKTAQTFYEQLAGRVRKPLRELVAELAAEEKRHYELFEAARDHPETEAHIRERIAVPVNDHRFSDYVHMPALGDHPDDQAILQYAMGREHAAHEHYADLAESAPEGPLKELFKFLSDEELRHKGDLEKRYYEIVHSGGV